MSRGTGRRWRIPAIAAVGLAWLAAISAYPTVARAAAPPAASASQLDNFIDPAFINTGGPPSPPVPGVALAGGRFPDKGVIAYGDARTFPLPPTTALTA